MLLNAMASSTRTYATRLMARWCAPALSFVFLVSMGCAHTTTPNDPRQTPSGIKVASSRAHAHVHDALGRSIHEVESTHAKAQPKTQPDDDAKDDAEKQPGCDYGGTTTSPRKCNTKCAWCADGPLDVTIDIH